MSEHTWTEMLQVSAEFLKVAADTIEDLLKDTPKHDIAVHDLVLEIRGFREDILKLLEKPARTLGSSPQDPAQVNT